MGKVSITVLNRINSRSKLTPVYIMYSHKSEKFLHNTSVYTQPGCLDKTHRRLKKTHPGNFKMDNAKIASIIDKINGLIDQAYLGFEEPTCDRIKERLHNPIKENTGNFIELLRQHYLPWVENNRSKNTVKQRYQIIGHLESFQAYKKIQLNIQYCVSVTFYNDYLKYLYEVKKMTANTVGIHVKRIKTFLYFLEAANLVTLPKNLKMFASPKCSNDPVTLNADEIDAIRQLEFKGNTYLEKYRDIFLVGVKTGLRISDLLDLRKKELVSIQDKGRFLQRTTIKTDESIELPLYGEVLDIFDKYKDIDTYLLPKVTEQKFNKYLKELGKLARITTEVVTVKMVKNVKSEHSQPKHMAMSAHMLRRTFITICADKGIPLHVIQKFTGHRDIRTLKRYIGATERDLKTELIKRIY